MEDSDLEEELHHAEDLLDEEAIRSKPQAATSKDPSGSKGSITDGDIANLRLKHSFLDGFSDYFIRNTPVGDLMKIQSTSLKMREYERSKDVDDKLATNKAEMASTFVEVPAGRDNRWSSLHPARFLYGAGCSAVRMWLAARDVIGIKPMPAIGSYDMAAVGLTGYVSSRGWAELHVLTSQKISVRMFNNHGTGKGRKDEEDGHMEVADFKLALRALRTAAAFVMPWNMSILALEGFYFQTNFCSTDLANVDKKSWYLVKFTDFVLHQNGDRWRDSEPFYTTGELKTAWAGFFGSQPQATTGSKAKKAINTKQGPRQGGESKMSLGICFAWNMGQCLKAAGACTTLKGKPLKHICDHNADPARPLEVCGKDHIRKDFHK